MQNFRMKNFNFYQRTPRLFSYAKIAIVGCGGSGSWIAESLVIAGCGNIVLIDDDILEDHNLNRTPYRERDIGQKKAIALMSILLGFRSNIKVQAVTKRLETHEDFQSTLSYIDLVIDATDSYDFKMKFTNNVIGYTPYLKVGYDGNMYDIDGGNEYIFDIAGNQGYTIISTTVMTTMMLASKVTQIAHAILTEGFNSRNVRVLGDIREELGITVTESGGIGIMTNNRGTVTDRIETEGINDDDDFEFEIVEVERERYIEPEKAELTDEEKKKRYTEVRMFLDMNSIEVQPFKEKIEKAIEKRDTNIIADIIKQWSPHRFAEITRVIIQ